MEDYIKCELIGGEFPGQFSNLFIAAVHYTHINTCYVLLLLLTTHVHHAVQDKIIRTNHTLLLVLAAPT